jgi:hypothetical protein
LNRSIFSLLLVFMLLTGCNVNVSEDEHSLPSFDFTTFDVSESTEADQKFYSALQKLIPLSTQVVKELDLLLAAYQQGDELAEAEEAMNIAKREMTAIWNQVHNDYHPEHETLRAMQRSYEDLLMSYIQGLGTELQGIEEGNFDKLKQGFQQSEKSKAALYKFSDDMKNFMKD